MPRVDVPLAAGTCIPNGNNSRRLDRNRGKVWFWYQRFPGVDALKASLDDALPWFVAVAASGGQGLEDIEQVLGALPEGLPVIVLVVLHRAWNRPTNLREVLGRSCALPVMVASDDERFRPGRVYIGKPEEHLTLAANSLVALIDDPDAIHRNRTADLLFRSVAAHAGSRMIGVVLAGALDDGSRGLAAIHAAGGSTMVVSPSGPPNGMPENAIKYDGPISYVGSAADIGSTVCRLIEGNRHSDAATIHPADYLKHQPGPHEKGLS